MLPIMPRPRERETAEASCPPANPAIGALMMSGGVVQGRVSERGDMVLELQGNGAGSIGNREMTSVSVKVLRRMRFESGRWLLK